jgi:hypothetical protein
MKPRKVRASPRDMGFADIDHASYNYEKVERPGGQSRGKHERGVYVSIGVQIWV